MRQIAAMLILFGLPGRTISWMACQSCARSLLRNFHSPVASVPRDVAGLLKRGERRLDLASGAISVVRSRTKSFARVSGTPGAPLMCSISQSTLSTRAIRPVHVGDALIGS